jgi:flagella basal body P-ring formation protein FlgA
MKSALCILTLSLGLLADSLAETAVQSHASIYSAIGQYIAGRIEFADYELTIAPLDNNLQLPDCAEALALSIPSDAIKAGRNTIGVHCNSPNPWTIFSSAIIKTYATVVISALPLQRGEMITRQHLSVIRRDVSGLRGDYLSRPEQVEHKQTIRPIPAGAILSRRNIAEPKLVKRGDKITISSARANFAIRMNGLAMMDGVKGQAIRIKNQSSGRIIQATVIEAGIVSVNH